MTQPNPIQNTQVRQILILGCFWAFLTGSFFAIPTLSPLVGATGIAIALAYSGAICLFGRPIMGVTIGLVTVLTIAYIVATGSDFSVINYAVWMALNLNFLVFGLLGISLRRTVSVRRSWLLTAGAFGGSLGLGWLFCLIVSQSGVLNS